MPNPLNTYPELNGLFNTIPPQPGPTRGDIFYNAAVPDYLKDKPGAPMPPPGAMPGKIGPPSGPPTPLDVGGGIGSDIISSLALGGLGRLGMGGLNRAVGMLGSKAPQAAVGALRGADPPMPGFYPPLPRSTASSDFLKDVRGWGNEAPLLQERLGKLKSGMTENKSLYGTAPRSQKAWQAQVKATNARIKELQDANVPLPPQLPTQPPRAMIEPVPQAPPLDKLQYSLQQAQDPTLKQSDPNLKRVIKLLKGNIKEEQLPLAR